MRTGPTGAGKEAMNKRKILGCAALAAALLIGMTSTALAAEKTDRPLLVNGQNPVPEGYRVELVTLENGMQAAKCLQEDLKAMLADCRAAGLDPMICSAYRTQATQTRLHNNKIARLRAAGYSLAAAKQEAARWVAAPGTSEHQTGLALDLVSRNYQVLDGKQAQTPEQQWLMEHCWENGFILRYPVDKGEITGIGYEPWHYRYVGRDYAAIHESGLCLEEYLARLDQLPAEGTCSRLAWEAAMGKNCDFHGAAKDGTWI